MDIKRMILAIANLIDRLEESSGVEKLNIYATIHQLQNEILIHVAEKRKQGKTIDGNNASMYFVEIDTPLKAMVNLAENGHSFEQNHQWCRTAVQKLRSQLCFDIQSQP